MGGIAEVSEEEPGAFMVLARAGVMSSGVRWGVEGATTGAFRPGIFAVGGGAYPVRPAIAVAGPGWAGFALEPEAVLCDGLDRGEGPPPYFSNSCCVELYFVAAFNLSMVPSLCICNSSKCFCKLDVR